MAIHRRVGYIPGEFTLYDRLTGAQHMQYFANLRGGVDPAYQASLVERLELDAGRRFKEYSKGNKQKVGLVIALQHRPELLILDEPTSGLDPLVQQTFFAILSEAVADGATVFLSSHILSEVEKTCDRVAIIREGRLVKVDTVEALRDLAHHEVELRFAGEVPAGVFEALPGVSDVAIDDHVLHLRVSGAITPVVQAAARYELLDFVSREPSLEDTFLAEYGQQAAKVESIMTVDAGQPPLAAPLPAIPLRSRVYGLGSVYGKTLRDSRLAFIVMTGLIAGLMLAVGSAWGTAYGSAEARAEIARLVTDLPAMIAGIAGPVVKPDTMGGFLTYKYGPFFAFLAGLWSILALSGTLAGEARRGSLDIVAVAPLGKRRIALEKLAAHVTAMAVSMLFLVIATLVASAVFGVPELGDAIPVSAAVGFALWVGLMGLVSGGVAFALAPSWGAAARPGSLARSCSAPSSWVATRRTCRPSSRSRSSPGSTGPTTTCRSRASTTGSRSGSWRR